MIDWMFVSAVVPTLFIFGVPIYFVRRYLKIREMEARALIEGRRSGAPETRLLEAENRELRDRLEKLEAIITSGDHELNRKLAALEVPGPGKGLKPTST